MNVLHINCNYMSTALHQTMIEHLDKINAKNQVFAPIYDENRSVIQPNNNVTVAKCFKKRDRYVFYYKQAKIGKALECNINVKEYDCIHAYTLFTDGNAAYTLSRKYNIPYVVAIRDTDVNFFLKKMFWMRKRGVKILKNASAVFFLSEAYRKHVLEKYIPANLQKNIYEKSHIIPNGIDDFWFENLYVDRDNTQRIQNFNNKKMKVSYVGAISKRKNVATTVKALEILESEGWEIEFTVAGAKVSDEEFDVLQSFSGTNYKGKLKKEEVIKCYRESDIFIMPSRTETFGLVYAEAMSQGLPVVYTKGQGFDGHFEAGVVGYAVEPYNICEIVQALKQLVLGYDERSKRCIEGVKRFEWDAICKEYASIYEKICGD